MEKILYGDALQRLKDLESESINICVTSPPYYNLRDYGVAGQLGREPTPEEYIDKLVEVFQEVRRVLRKDGTLWVNIGDSYVTHSGSQPPGGTRNKNGHTEKKPPEGYKALLKNYLDIYCVRYHATAAFICVDMYNLFFNRA